MRVMVVMSIMLATTLRLLVAWIDLSAPRADPAIEDRATSFAVAVLNQSFAVVIQPVMLPAEAVRTFAGLAVVVIGQWGMRAQIESLMAAAARTTTVDVRLTTSIAGPAGAGTGVALTAVAATAPQNQRRRRQDVMSAMRVSMVWMHISLSPPVAKGRASCVGTAAADTPEAVALVNAA